LSSFTLKELGYILDSTVRGVEPEIVFTVPRYHDVLSQKGSQATINLDFSPNIKPDSRIQISVDNTPIFESTLDKIQHNQVTIPIPYTNDLGNPLVVIHVKGKLNGDVMPWMTLLNDSTINYNLNFAKIPAFSTIVNQNNRHIPLQVTSDDPEVITATAQLASAIGALYFPWKVTTSLVDDKQNTNTPRVYIGEYAGNTSSGLVLTIAEINEIIDHILLLNMSRQNYSLFIKNVNPARSNIEERTLVTTLENLGYNNISLSGKGELSFLIPLNAITLNNNLKNVYANVKSTLSSEDRKNVLFTLKLNGTAYETLSSDELRKYHSFDALKNLKAQNLLEIIVSYFPKDPSAKEILVNLSQESNFEYENSSDFSNLNISSYPWLFTGNGYILLSSLSYDYLSAVVKMVELYGRVHGVPTRLEISQITTDLKISSDYDYFLAFTNLNDTNYLDTPVEVYKDFYLMNPLTKQIYFDSRKDNYLGIMQIYEQFSKKPMLTLTDNSTKPFEWLKTLSLNQFFVLQENVAIYTQHEWFSIPTGLHIRPYYGHINLLTEWWYTYRVYVLLGLLALWAIFILYVQRNLTERALNNDKIS
jgi:hypothetical protein